ncbi:hypothetical protein MKW92_051486 [Papaver armeniacum]|nr:hypothetical protein MKW92_051486 [Papaver armeniacum]
MASQVTSKLQKVGSSATHDTLKILRSPDEGKTSIITVCVTRIWEELDFMSTNDVTSVVDMAIVDEQGEELHAVVPKNLIWKFDKQIREGSKPKFRPAHNEKRGFFRCTTSVTALDAILWPLFPINSVSLNVVGFLKTATNIQLLQRFGGQSSRMREITIENLKGTTMKIALWGSAANQVGNDPIDCESIPLPVLVVVCSTFVKYYQESSSVRITLSSKNATKVYADADIPEVVEIRESLPGGESPQHFGSTSSILPSLKILNRVNWHIQVCFQTTKYKT